MSHNIIPAFKNRLKSKYGVYVRKQKNIDKNVSHVLYDEHNEIKRHYYQAINSDPFISIYCFVRRIENC